MLTYRWKICSLLGGILILLDASYAGMVPLNSPGKGRPPKPSQNAPNPSTVLSNVQSNLPSTLNSNSQQTNTPPAPPTQQQAVPNAVAQISNNPIPVNPQQPLSPSSPSAPSSPASPSAPSVLLQTPALVEQQTSSVVQQNAQKPPSSMSQAPSVQHQTPPKPGSAQTASSQQYSSLPPPSLSQAPSSAQHSPPKPGSSQSSSSQQYSSAPPPSLAQTPSGGQQAPPRPPSSLTQTHPVPVPQQSPPKPGSSHVTSSQQYSSAPPPSSLQSPGSQQAAPKPPSTLTQTPPVSSQQQTPQKPPSSMTHTPSGAQQTPPKPQTPAGSQHAPPRPPSSLSQAPSVPQQSPQRPPSYLTQTPPGAQQTPPRPQKPPVSHQAPPKPPPSSGQVSSSQLLSFAPPPSAVQTNPPPQAPASSTQPNPPSAPALATSNQPNSPPVNSPPPSSSSPSSSSALTFGLHQRPPSSFSSSQSGLGLGNNGLLSSTAASNDSSPSMFALQHAVNQLGGSKPDSSSSSLGLISQQLGQVLQSVSTGPSSSSSSQAGEPQHHQQPPPQPVPEYFYTPAQQQPYPQQAPENFYATQQHGEEQIFPEHFYTQAQQQPYPQQVPEHFYMQPPQQGQEQHYTQQQPVLEYSQSSNSQGMGNGQSFEHNVQVSAPLSTAPVAQPQSPIISSTGSHYADDEQDIPFDLEAYLAQANLYYASQQAHSPTASHGQYVHEPAGHTPELIPEVSSPPMSIEDIPLQNPHLSPSPSSPVSVVMSTYVSSSSSSGGSTVMTSVGNSGVDSMQIFTSNNESPQAPAIMSVEIQQTLPPQDVIAAAPPVSATGPVSPVSPGNSDESSALYSSSGESSEPTQDSHLNPVAPPASVVAEGLPSENTVPSSYQPESEPSPLPVPVESPPSPVEAPTPAEDNLPQVDADSTSSENPHPVESIPPNEDLQNVIPVALDAVPLAEPPSNVIFEATINNVEDLGGIPIPGEDGQPAYIFVPLNIPQDAEGTLTISAVPLEVPQDIDVPELLAQEDDSHDDHDSHVDDDEPYPPFDVDQYLLQAALLLGAPLPPHGSQPANDYEHHDHEFHDNFQSSLELYNGETEGVIQVIAPPAFSDVPHDNDLHDLPMDDDTVLSVASPPIFISLGAVHGPETESGIHTITQVVAPNEIDDQPLALFQTESVNEVASSHLEDINHQVLHEQQQSDLIPDLTANLTIDPVVPAPTSLHHEEPSHVAPELDANQHLYSLQQDQDQTPMGEHSDDLSLFNNSPLEALAAESDDANDNFDHQNYFPVYLLSGNAEEQQMDTPLEELPENFSNDAVQNSIVQTTDGEAQLSSHPAAEDIPTENSGTPLSRNNISLERSRPMRPIGMIGRPSMLGISPMHSYVGGKLNGYMGGLPLLEETNKFVTEAVSGVSVPAKNKNNGSSIIMHDNRNPQNGMVSLMGNTVFNSHVTGDQPQTLAVPANAASFIMAQGQKLPFNLSPSFESLLQTPQASTYNTAYLNGLNNNNLIDNNGANADNPPPSTISSSQMYNNYYNPEDSIRNATVLIQNGMMRPLMTPMFFIVNTNQAGHHQYENDMKNIPEESNSNATSNISHVTISSESSIVDGVKNEQQNITGNVFIKRNVHKGNGIVGGGISPNFTNAMPMPPLTIAEVNNIISNELPEELFPDESKNVEAVAGEVALPLKAKGEENTNVNLNIADKIAEALKSQGDLLPQKLHHHKLAEENSIMEGEEVDDDDDEEVEMEMDVDENREYASVAPHYENNIPDPPPQNEMQHNNPEPEQQAPPPAAAASQQQQAPPPRGPPPREGGPSLPPLPQAPSIIDIPPIPEVLSIPGGLGEISIPEPSPPNFNTPTIPVPTLNMPSVPKPMADTKGLGRPSGSSGKAKPSKKPQQNSSKGNNVSPPSPVEYPQQPQAPISVTNFQPPQPASPPQQQQQQQYQEQFVQEQQPQSFPQMPMESYNYNPQLEEGNNGIADYAPSAEDEDEEEEDDEDGDEKYDSEGEGGLVSLPIIPVVPSPTIEKALPGKYGSSSIMGNNGNGRPSVVPSLATFSAPYTTNSQAPSSTTNTNSGSNTNNNNNNNNYSGNNNNNNNNNYSSNNNDKNQVQQQQQQQPCACSSNSNSNNNNNNDKNQNNNQQQAIVPPTNTFSNKPRPSPSQASMHYAEEEIEAPEEEHSNARPPRPLKPKRPARPKNKKPSKPNEKNADKFKDTGVRDEEVPIEHVKLVTAISSANHLQNLHHTNTKYVPPATEENEKYEEEEEEESVHDEEEERRPMAPIKVTFINPGSSNNKEDSRPMGLPGPIKVTFVTPNKDANGDPVKLTFTSNVLPNGEETISPTREGEMMPMPLQITVVSTNNNTKSNDTAPTLSSSSSSYSEEDVPEENHIEPEFPIPVKQQNLITSFSWFGWEIPVLNWNYFTDFFNNIFGRNFRTTSGVFTCDESDDDSSALRSTELDVDYLCGENSSGRTDVDSNICNMFCESNGFYSGICIPQKACLCYMTEDRNFAIKLDRLKDYSSSNYTEKVSPNAMEEASENSCQTCSCLKSCQKAGNYIGYCSGKSSCHCGVPWYNEYPDGKKVLPK